ncbi:PE-PPE domain-containing protein [Mycobacterium sp. SP-6446]|uniref:PE-PPE domain-containing protein n=1 Tax=Mycobacterium sp. SP-6446 TaxID=1834162 RepID=UPI0020CA1273|nr:PE-PPE domain-containing protein [Mycobacterium sp. SP-6446]
MANQIDPLNLIRPVINGLGTFGTGHFSGIDPTQVLSGISKAVDATSMPLQQAMGSVANDWQGESGAAAIAATRAAIANGTEVANQANGLGDNLLTAASNVAQARQQMIDIIDEYQATLAASDLSTPSGRAHVVAAANQANTEATAVVQELRAKLASQASQVSAIGTPVGVTQAPTADNMPLGHLGFGYPSAAGGLKLHSGAAGNGTRIQSADQAALASRVQSSNSHAGSSGTANTGNVTNAAFASTMAPASRTGTALIMGGTGNPQPNAGYVTAVDGRYIAPKYPGYTPVGVYTPEQFWPVTGLTSETFGQSVAQGVPLLNNAIMTHTAAGSHVAVLGYSQSATIATLEMRHLDNLPADARPSPDQLSFVLLGDPNNPNGGILERFNGLYIPGLDVPFNGATPPNTPYPTAIHTIQYDPIGDFPQYPIDLPADANAIAGYFYLHGAYPNLTAAQLATAIPEPVSPGYAGSTSYDLIPTQNLPLLDPLRQIGVPSPIIDLIQPDLREIVDLGYDRAGYANVPTPAGLFPNVNPFTVVGDLDQATTQGVHDALRRIG